MNQLEYVKEQFTKDCTIIEFVYETDVLSSRYIDFLESIVEVNKLIVESKSIDSVMSHINELQRRFLVHWNFMHNETENPFTKKMQTLYFSANLNDPEKWLKDTIATYDIKNSNGFFEYVKKGLKFINSSKKDIDFKEISIIASAIIKKYNLKSLDVSNIKQQNIKKYIINIDKSLDNLCESLGVTPDVIGLHGSISFAATSYSFDAYFQPMTNTIVTGNAMIDSSTLLHEWIHAIDFDIGNKIQKYKFASQIESSVVIDDSKLYEAFKNIKELTQEIFSSSNQVKINSSIKKELMQEGCSNFFKLLLSVDFYFLPETTIQSFNSENALKLVNNYLVDAHNEKNQDRLIDFLIEKDICFTDVIQKIKNPDEDLKSSKSFFDLANLNTLGEKSFYYLSSHFSRHSTNMNETIEKFFKKAIMFLDLNKEKILNLNIRDDYLIQPTEMLARYFESQTFPKKYMIYNIVSCITGLNIYKIGKDKNFVIYKDNIIENICGKDKIIKNISAIRKQHQTSTNNSINKNI